MPAFPRSKFLFHIGITPDVTLFFNRANYPYKYAMSTITLSCLVVGENPYENAFAVEIDTTKLVSFFRDAIKEKIDDNVKAKDLKLWKVDISLEKENKKLELVNTKINVNIKDELGGEELPPLSKISKHFSSQPADEHIHIIVQRPVETKEVHCTATYGRHKPEKFLWAVTRGQITLSWQWERTFNRSLGRR
ncbi:hypothetical protein RhiirC2_295841 [Rhizophagus irregularis]|uniref:Crinkler effector protein N-terminal domain-containing protein n=1 Tax=Rhizophagus irregularis TaxID=588596 RepID=A0A2N1MCM1_9GLOM|nr:hypothetical protein RhiirC2_295841 [Rhizophagus irregularis]